jgi:hypothetical protein
VLSGSITVSLDGLTPPVVSVSLPQPGGAGVLDVSLILRPSADDRQLLRDFLLGQPLRRVQITLSDGAHGQDTIHLRNAVITSYRLTQDTTQGAPSVALTLEGLTSHAGPIAAAIDGVTPPVVSLTVPQPTASGAQDISLVVRVTRGISQLFQDVDAGKVIPEVAITLNQVGNGSTATVVLSDVVISSIRVVGDGDIPTVEVDLVAREETIRRS